MWYVRRMILPFLIFGLIVFVLSVIFRQSIETPTRTYTKTLQVLSYPNFTNTWGPGPELAKRFFEEYGVSIKWVEASNAGMILQLLRQEHKEIPDVVLGLDILSLPIAEQGFKWHPISLKKVDWVQDIPIDEPFVPFDWAPMTFIYKRQNMLPPKHLEELKQEKYINSLALQDPNSSSTGMYFLMWVLSVMGEDEGFQFLQQLKPSIRVISPSWSASYSLFKNDQVPYVFSYFTSPLYHHLEEQDFTYQPVYFEDPHVYAVEYGAIPENCKQCSAAEDFLKFLLRPENQKIIMQKNFMLPVIKNVKKGTEFDFPQKIQLIDPKTYKGLLEHREDLLKRWQALQL
ncbi:MAG: thiamine ABC transporter substrate-binding protein [Bdellovibrionaceae bacterium]|nr:thiamine ABC transporter substrate-binding protein [Pseudobdellovibrionaceae bacterium]